jgi:hypothetical protein
MSTHGDPDPGDALSVVIAQFGQLHTELRQEVAHRSDASLNWIPCAGANSVATIVTHTLGSEAETLRAVAGTPSVRDRNAEFRRGDQRRIDVLAQIDAADALLGDLEPALTAARAAIAMSLPTLPADDRRSGMTWLIGNLGHAREHMGHLRLTVQLLDGPGTPQAETSGPGS